MVTPQDPIQEASRTMRTQLHQIVAAMAARRPGAPALTIKDTTLSYAELWDETRAFAAGVD